MSDAQDVKQRVNDAWRAAATRAYEAAHGVVDAPAVGEARTWRWVMSTRVAITLAGALAVIAAVAAWWPRAPQGEAVPFPTEAATVTEEGSAQVPLQMSSVTVHVAGAVQSPGLYKLDAGARVAEAIDAAGGAVNPSDLDLLNLARPLRDGERVAVGVEEAQGGGLINLNTASESELVALPGVGPVLAARIVAYRDAHGPFGSVDDLDSVSGVGPAVLAGLREDATV